jgi:hypothetical protein
LLRRRGRFRLHGSRHWRIELAGERPKAIDQDSDPGNRPIHGLAMTLRLVALFEGRLELPAAPCLELADRLELGDQAGDLPNLPARRS